MLNGNGKNANSLANTVIGGRGYPFVSVPQCRVCTSPHRLQIEKLLVSGYGYASVVRQLPDEHGLTPRNLQDHVANGHLPVKVESVARFAEERAKERGEVAEAGADLVEKAFEVVETVLGKVWSKLRDGDLDPGVREGLAAAKLALEYEALVEQRIDQQQVYQEILAFLAEAKKVMQADEFAEYVRRLRANPAVRVLNQASRR